jgi:predicted Rossmann-fold nucleotide-binding protein
MRSCCVFCGSSPGRRPEYEETARALGTTLATRGIELVYGGAQVGLMGAVADAALAIVHEGLSELFVVESMHERKSKMAELSEGFVALPGGMGTFEELLETLTWAQLGVHERPCGLLDVGGYYGPLLELLDRAVEERFLKAEQRGLLMVESEPGALLDRFEAYSPVQVTKWLDRQKT